MTLIELLIVICFFIAVEAAYMSANYLKLGFLGHAIALVLGLAIGIGFAWSMWLATSKIAKWTDSLPKPYRGICTVGFLILMLAWIIVAGIVGDILPNAVLHLIF